MNRHENVKKYISRFMRGTVEEQFMEDYIKQAEQTEKELALYKQFVSHFPFETLSIDCSEYTMSFSDDMHIVLDLYKQIQALGGK
jgi:hypothetical protein